MMVGSCGYDPGIIFVHMMQINHSFLDDGGIMCIWWLDHMGMMVGSYGYDGWVIWV